MTDLNDPDIQLPATIATNRHRVVRDFWGKMRRGLSRIPFADDALAVYFCALDPATPTRVRAILLAALAYFVLPTDLIPDFFVGVGFTDDAAVLATAIGMVAPYITDAHRERARAALARLRDDLDGAAPA
jgi:uncharacterized membrane protein YkvA (DUF1232 family)